MKIHKKFGIWLALLTALLAVGFFAHTNKASAAPIGFTNNELKSAAQAGIDFRLSQPDNWQSIIITLKHNNVSNDITFTGGPTSTPIVGAYYTYKNTSDFCRPTGRIGADNYPASDESVINIQITDNNPFKAKIVNVEDRGNHFSYLWPTDKQNCGTLKESADGLVEFWVPDYVDKGKLDSTGPVGTGSQYSQSDISSASFSYTSSGAGIIEMSFTDQSLGKVKFIDSDPYDTNFEYVSPKVFCNGGGGGAEGKLHLQLNNAGANDTISAQLTKIGYFESSGKCNTSNQDSSKKPFSYSVTNPDIKLSDSSSSKAAQAFAQWDGDSIDLLSCDTNAICSAKFTLSLLTGSNTKYFFKNDQNSKCTGYTIDLASKDSYTGTYYLNSGDKKCNNLGQRAVAILLTKGQTPPGGGGGGGSGTGTDDGCFSSGWALSWLACPVITTAQTAANAMYGFVEDQLKFCVKQNKSDLTCDNKVGGDSLGAEHDSVHSAWSNFRILVSGLVVILLLVMVISQAIGTGPFDAYTVRKMLPRLVIGVILIQISWPLFSWVINTVEHLGVGLADLMYAPFGGSDALNLSEVMQPFTSGTAEVFNWIGFFGVAIGAVVAPFLMLGIILTVLVAIFVGFLTLLFRKIIIILALIFVPVALISWMMPNDGLRKYWKLWWDNFSKALMMFPLIIAMIAGGRIFAKIGSGQHDFVGFFIVLIGFFGPLFILPKTFKWGGTLMKTAGQGIASAGQKGLKKPMEGLKGMNERYQGKNANRLDYNARQGKFARTRRLAGIGLRRTQSGHMIPFNKRSRKLALQTGDKWSHEEDEIAATYGGRVYNKALQNGYQARNKDGSLKFDAAGNPVILKDVAAAKQALVDLAHHEDHRIAKGAITQLVKTSSWPEIESAVDANGNRVYENNKNWTDTLAKDETLYPAVLRSRVDTASHIVSLAERAASTTRSINEALDEMGVTDVRERTALHADTKKFKNLYQMHYAISKQMSNEDFATQSDGFWQEAGDLSEGAGGQAVQAALQKRFAGILAIGGTAPQQLLGHLVTETGSAEAPSLQDHVDRALTGVMRPGKPATPTTPAVAPATPPDDVRRYLR